MAKINAMKMRFLAFVGFGLSAQEVAQSMVGWGKKRQKLGL